MTKIKRQLLAMEVEQHTRIELATPAWKADMLPLHQCCKEVGYEHPGLTNGFYMLIPHNEREK